MKKTSTSKLKIIATITCHWAYNYGAVLQTYALVEALKPNSAFVIDYTPRYVRAVCHRTVVGLAKYLIRRVFDYTKGAMVFRRFVRDEIPLSTSAYTTLGELEKNPPLADVYITGSDQVWNAVMNNGRDDAFFLTFAPNGKQRTSYAASIATAYIPSGEKARFAKNLRGFSCISVREKTAVELLRDIGIENVETVLDPVYLLTSKDWNGLARKSKLQLEKRKYILVYGFERQKNLYRYAKRLAKARGYKLFSINTSIDDFLLGVDKYYWNASPYDFLYLMKHAAEVVTNSFHGVSFSILYKKPFHFFTKTGKENSRMVDLLDAFGLSRRTVKDEALLCDRIDYAPVYSILEKRRRESLAFLHKIVEGK